MVALRHPLERDSRWCQEEEHSQSLRLAESRKGNLESWETKVAEQSTGRGERGRGYESWRASEAHSHVFSSVSISTCMFKKKKNQGQEKNNSAWCSHRPRIVPVPNQFGWKTLSFTSH